MRLLATTLVLSLLAVATLSLPAAAQRHSSTTVIPAGTQISVRISENLSSATNHAGDTFHGSLVEPIVANGRTVYPAGSEVTGTVLSAHPSGRLSDPGVLELGLISVTSNGRTTRLNADPFVIKGESHTKSNVEKIGGIAAAGAVIGAIAGGGKGAAIGAGAGAAPGTGVAAATGKKEAKVESEAVLTWNTASDSTAYSGGSGNDRAPAASSPPPPSYSEDQENSDWQVFSARDRRSIRTCFQQNESSLPPGLAKREQLPPGLQKQLERNGTLPPGLQKRVQPLPDVCENQLGPLPEGAWRGVYSRRVMLIDQDSRILDAFNLDDQ
ncbi:MAG TPA: hypothetical protein VE825_06350 [Terriglobales bacterium]|jgi:hypothetical protein|nr:hypothetical protein [Terriglobales bacterium]